MKLLIAIPALNEEDSIQGIIQRALDARAGIMARSPVTEVDITVVSDGSTDRTVERAQAYADQVDVIVFERNKGYGAAIQEAWARSDAELLGFLDADGTCDPAFFTELCTKLEADGADVVLGCRMTPESAMPLLRRAGNLVFARMLTAFSSYKVRDTASGMRVVRRSSLQQLLPLPDGLHFTPAMTARAVLSDDLRLAEIDMPYHEREGRSKLRAHRDGLRFLLVILRAVSLYRPSRLFGLFGTVALSAAALLMLGPALHYVRHQTLQEWMIYRFIVSDLLGVTACLLLAAGYLTRRIVGVTILPGSTVHSRLHAAFRSAWFWLVPTVLVLGGTLLVVDSFLDRVTTGATYEHWSRFVAMSFLFSVSLILVVTRVIDYFLDLVAERLEHLAAVTVPREERQEARVV